MQSLQTLTVKDFKTGIENAEKKHRLRDQAMEWDLAIKLSFVFGLRPIEVSHSFLEVKKNGKEYLFCSYCKKAGGGLQSKEGFGLYTLNGKKMAVIRITQEERSTTSNESWGW